MRGETFKARVLQLLDETVERTEQGAVAVAARLLRRVYARSRFEDVEP